MLLLLLLQVTQRRESGDVRGAAARNARARHLADTAEKPLVDVCVCSCLVARGAVRSWLHLQPVRDGPEFFLHASMGDDDDEEVQV
jgi:hypothetical protein